MTDPAIRGRRLPVVALLAANAVSNIGNSLSLVAVPWFVLETTGSPTRTGIIAFFHTIPTILGGFFGGTIVDRLGHRRSSILADILSGMTIAAIPLLHVTTGIAYWQLLVLVFLGAVFDSPGMTARLAILPELAQRAKMPLERVNAAGQSIQGLSVLIGPPLAGLLIAAMDATSVLWIDAATFAVSALLVRLLVPLLAVGAAEGEGSYLRQLREGFRFMVGDPLIRGLLIPFAVVNFLTAPMFSVVMPVFARREFGSAQDLGLLIGSFGAGSIAGAVLYGWMQARIPKFQGLVVAILVSGLPIWALAAGPPFLLCVVLLFISGLGAGPINPIAITALQQRVAPEMLGRALGIAVGMSMVASPAGMLVAGALLEWIGPPGTFTYMALGFAFVTGWIALNPSTRELNLPSAVPAEPETVAT
ncbi:MAG: MFS transporter [Dehalococcoidia bacterium]|nr:MFS transporter [Dehalococcoidia bacterium]